MQMELSHSESLRPMGSMSTRSAKCSFFIMSNFVLPGSVGVCSKVFCENDVSCTRTLYDNLCIYDMLHDQCEPRLDLW